MLTCLNDVRWIILMICNMKIGLEMLNGHFYAKTTKLLFLVTLFLQKPISKHVE